MRVFRSKKSTKRKTGMFILTSMAFLLICLSSFGQDDNVLMVSRKGQLIDFPCIGLYSYRPENVLPEIKLDTKSITIKRYDLSNKSGELKRIDNYVEYTIHYDYLGRVERFEVKEALFGNITHNVIYDNQYRVVGYEDNNLGNWKYNYDEKGFLKSLIRRNITFVYSFDAKGNTKIDEYMGSTIQNTHTCRYDALGRKSYYCNKTKTGRLIEETRWNYDGSGRLMSIRKKQPVMDLFGSNRTKENEYRFEYGKDGNPLRCIIYECGDISTIKGGYEYEFEYKYFLDELEEEKIEEEE